MSMGKPNKPKSRRDPEELQVVMAQTKPDTQDETAFARGHDAW
jgi:hypothetical protein